MKKRIAIITDHEVTHDGRVQRIVKSFLAKGFLVDLFLPKVVENDEKIFDNKNLRFVQYIKENTWLNRNILFSRSYVDSSKKIIEQNIPYDFIYVNDYPLLESGVKVKKLLNSELIYDTHEIYVETINQLFPRTGRKRVYGKLFIAFNKFFHFQKEKQLIKNADFVVTVCNSFRDYLNKSYRIKCDVIKNCPLELPNLESSNIIRERLGLKANDKILLYQGMYTKGRGIEKLVRAAGYFDNSIHLVLLGGGPLLGELRQLSAKNNNVHFLDLVPYKELFHYVSSADMGILLIEAFNKSKELTLPNKVFDYMTGGIPFITNNLPEGSAIALKHDCGIVIEDQNAEIVAENINSIFKTDHSAKGEKGQRAIKEHYLWHYDFDRFFEKLNINSYKGEKS